jgi:hypothetical protein
MEGIEEASGTSGGTAVYCMTVQCDVCCRGLLYCMEYLEDNLDEWLGQELEVSPRPWSECGAGLLRVGLFVRPRAL